MEFAVEQRGGSNTHRSFSPEELAGEVALFEDALWDLALRPSGGSKALTAFSAAASEDLYDSTGNFPEFREVTEEFLKNRPELDMDYKVQLFWRTFQYHLIGQPDYPKGYVIPEVWQVAFRDILKDPDKRDTVEEQLLIYNVQTTEPRRYAGLKVALAVYGPLLPERFSLVEAGSSVGLGQIQLRENVAFPPFKVNSSPEVRKELRNKLLARLAFSKMVGFDQLPINAGTLQLIEAHSSYPNEVNAPERKQLRDQLYSHRQGTESIWADLTVDDDRLEQVRRQVPGGQFDVAAELTTFYEIPEVERPEAMVTWANLARHLLVVQDYAAIDPADPTDLVFDQGGAAKGAPYTLHTKYRDDPEQPWQEIPWQKLGRWDSGRCRAFTPTVALANLCLKGVACKAS